MLEELIRCVEETADESYPTIVDGLSVGKRTHPHTFEALIYEPLVCLILQGSKHTIIGNQDVHVCAGECIIVSHPLPVVARVAEASPERPFLSMVVHLDLSELRSLYDTIGEGLLGPHPGQAFSAAAVQPETLDVFARYAALADDPDDARVLAPLVRRELHYRLLKADSGGMLRQLLRRDSHASSIAQAIQALRQNYRHRLEMAELAHAVGMSASSFYRHFKDVTATTPLQYQKDLRLTEARRLLRDGEHTVSAAAYAVGYESPSQFSREYSRKFGASPRSDRRSA
ncbi:MAG: AraC family transcriptional regulator [Myxococcota bacterium]